MKLLIAGLAWGLLVGCSGPAKGPRDVRAAFIARVKELPTAGEFHTPAAVQSCRRDLPVLLSLDERDLAGEDLYPFCALASELAVSEEIRVQVARAFESIPHQEMKLFWAVLLHDRGPRDPRVVGFLREAARVPDKAALLAEMVGPKWPELRAQLTAEPEL